MTGIVCHLHQQIGSDPPNLLGRDSQRQDPQCWESPCRGLQRQGLWHSDLRCSASTQPALPGQVHNRYENCHPSN
jgi:hypothetical protein